MAPVPKQERVALGYDPVGDVYVPLQVDGAGKLILSS